MDSPDRLLELIRALYAAPGTVDGWRHFLGELCSTIDGTAANFISHDLRVQRAMVSVAAKTDPEAINAYVTHWGQQDPWAYSPRAHQLTPGRVVLGESLVPNRELKRTAFYNEFSRHYDIGDCIAAMIEAGPDRMSLISINASGAHRFDGEARQLLSALMPHLERAIQLHRRLIQAEGTTLTSLDAFDRSGTAALLLDHAGRVSYASARAAALLRKSDGLVVEKGELLAATPAETNALREVVRAAVLAGRGEGIESGGVVAVSRPSGRRPLRVLVAPVCSPVAFPISATGAIVLVTDPDDVPVPTEAEIQVLLGLTTAEARLAHALAAGLTLGTAARRLGLTIETVRTRLKNIFTKTGTHRQAELMRVILSLRVGRP